MKHIWYYETHTVLKYLPNEYWQYGIQTVFNGTFPKVVADLMLIEKHNRQIWKCCCCKAIVNMLRTLLLLVYVYGTTRRL